MKFKYRFFDPQFRKSFYFRILILYSLFTFVVIITSSSVLTLYLDKKLETEISRTNKSLLSQVQIFSDTYLIGKVNSIVIEKFLDITNDGNLQDFFTYTGLGRTAVLQRVYQNILNTKLSNSFIDSVYIYRKSDDTLVTSGEKITFNATSPQNVYADIINTELIKSTMLSEKEQSWVSPLENKKFWGSRPIISFCQSIPMLSSDKDRLGCFIINIDVELFFQNLNKVSDSNKGEIVVMDSNGRLFANNKNNKLFDTEFSELLLKNIGSTGDGVMLTSIGGKEVAISCVNSSVNDWKYISIEPLETIYRTKSLAMQFSILVIGILTILSLLGLNFITVWLYKPLNTIIKAAKAQFKAGGGENNSKSDLSLINDVIVNLSTKVIEMEDTLQKNKGLIQNKIAVDILYENVSTLEELNKRLQLAGICFRHGQFCLIITEMDENLFNRLLLEQREFVTYMLMDLINGYFEKMCSSITVSQSASSFTSILNLDNYDAVRKSLNELPGFLKRELGLNYNIALSDVIPELPMFRKTYSDTANYLKYSFIHGYGNVFSHEIIAGFEANNRDFDLNSLKDLETLLRASKLPQLKEEIEVLINDAKQGSYSYNYVQSTLMNIIGLICRVSHEQGINSQILDKNKMMNDFSGIKSIDDCFEWICGLIDVYDRNINIRNDSIDTEFVEKITKYIDNNIDNQISLNVLAEKFNMSMSYISKIFKEGTGTGFSDYVLAKKIEKAAQLLVEDKKSEVSKIAEKLGYLNLSYFSKLFKERYGMTPLQYRKKNIE